MLTPSQALSKEGLGPIGTSRSLGGFEKKVSCQWLCKPWGRDWLESMRQKLHVMNFGMVLMLTCLAARRGGAAWSALEAWDGVGLVDRQRH